MGKHIDPKEEAALAAIRAGMLYAAKCQMQIDDIVLAANDERRGIAVIREAMALSPEVLAFIRNDVAGRA